MGSFDRARWQVEVPATRASRLMMPDGPDEFRSAFAPTVPIHPAYASMTPLPTAIPGESPISAAALSLNCPAHSPAL